MKIRYRLSEQAKVTLNIYDGRDLLVKKISSKNYLEKGDHSFLWDGRDQKKRIVPPEAYRYTLVAKNKKGQTTEHDLSDLTGGKNIIAQHVKWDPQTKKIGYQLVKAGRVNIRIGLANDGPLLNSLLNWVPRSAGFHQEAWDGKDTSGVLDLTHHPKMQLGVQAFSLSDNTIIVGPERTKVSLLSDYPWKENRRVVKKTPKRKMYAHNQQPIDTRRDFSVSLQLPKYLRKKKGLPLVTKTIPIQLKVDAKDRQRLLSQRFEPVFFVDGQYVFENEVGFFPMTWRWDPRGINKGIHYLTVNVRGYEGNFGTATTKVYVDTKQ